MSQRNSIIDQLLDFVLQFASVTQLLLLLNFLFFGIQLVIQSLGGSVDLFDVTLSARRGLFFAQEAQPVTPLSQAQIAQIYCQNNPLECALAIRSPIAFPDILWQPITSMFIHGGLFHIGFNMFILWQLGQGLQQIWSPKYFLKYYFFCGIVSGIVVALFNILMGAGFGITLGASGAIFGLLVAFGVLFPNVTFYLFFAMPIQAKYMVIIYGVISVLFLFTGSLQGISHIGHLGGLIAGLIMLKGPRLLRNL